MDAISRLKALLAELEAAQVAPEGGENVTIPEVPSKLEVPSEASRDISEKMVTETASVESDNGTTEMEPSTVENVEVIAPPEDPDAIVITPENPEGGVSFRFGEIESRLSNLDAAISDAVFRISKMEENISTINTAIDVASASPAVSVATDIGSVVRRL